MVAKDDEGDEADEDVEVVELGLAFLDLSATALDKEVEGCPASELRLPSLLGSLLRPPNDSGSEQGLRKGDLLSLSRRKTTAIEPPTTGPPVTPTGPLAPWSSIPSFPEAPEAPVVLLTPSRTSTDTLDCSLLLRLPPLSFFDLPECPDSFLTLFSPSSLSLPNFLLRLAAGSAGKMEAETEVAWVGESKDWPLPLTRIKEDNSDFFPVRDFLGW